MTEEKLTPADGTTVEATPSAAEPNSLLARREALYAKYDAQQQKVTEPAKKSEPEVVPEDKEAASSEADVKEPKPATPPVSEEKKKEKGAEALVPKQALDEERSRRKQAVLKQRELEQRLKDIEDRLKAAPAQKADEAEDLDPREKELRELRARDAERAKADEAAKVQQAEAERTKRTKEATEKLDSEGFPGFDLAINLIREEMIKMFNDAEIEEADFGREEMWHKVFKERVYAQHIAPRFGLAKRKKMLDDKLAAKEKAGLVGSPGSAPEDKKEEKKEPTIEELNAAYIKERQAAGRNLIR